MCNPYAVKCPQELFRKLIALIMVCLMVSSSQAAVVFSDNFQNRTDDDAISFGNLNSGATVGSYQTSGLGGGATYQDDGVSGDVAALLDGFSTNAIIAAQFDNDGDGNTDGTSSPGKGGVGAADNTPFFGTDTISATWDAHKRRTGSGKDYTMSFQQAGGADVLQVKWLNGGQVNVLVDDGTGTALTFDTKVYDPVSYPNKSDQNGSETWKPAGTTDGAWQFSVDFSEDLAVVQVTDDEGNSDGAFNIDLSGIGLVQQIAQLNFSVTGGTGTRGLWVDNLLVDATFVGTVCGFGDTDCDGMVETATVGNLGDDLGPIIGNFFTNQSFREDGDLTEDGFVDFADFREWKDNVPGGSSLVLAELLGATVPEPSSGLLLTGSIAILMTTRRSSSSRR